MKPYKTSLTITDSKRIILSNMPFEAGDKVEVVVYPIPNDDHGPRVKRLEDLLRETQSISQIRRLTDDDVIREVRAHRDGK